MTQEISKIARGSLLLVAAAIGAAGAAVAAIQDGAFGASSHRDRGSPPSQQRVADAPPLVVGTDFKSFTPDERAFIEAAVDRQIPPNPVEPGALEANKRSFLDRQLPGPFGRGDHYYLGGPWKEGTSEQGYHMRFSPARLYRTAIEQSTATRWRNSKREPSPGSATPTRPSPLSMPSCAWELTSTDVPSFVRNSWGNRTSPVSSGKVGALRERLDPQQPPYTDSWGDQI